MNELNDKQKKKPKGIFYLVAGILLILFSLFTFTLVFTSGKPSMSHPERIMTPLCVLVLGIASVFKFRSLRQ